MTSPKSKRAKSCNDTIWWETVASITMRFSIFLTHSLFSDISMGDFVLDTSCKRYVLEFYSELYWNSFWHLLISRCQKRPLSDIIRRTYHEITLSVANKKIAKPRRIYLSKRGAKSKFFVVKTGSKVAQFRGLTLVLATPITLNN